jgi:hypothetical protein
MLFIVAMGWLSPPAGAAESCNGPHNHQSPGSPEALKKILETHEAWIKAGRPKPDQINVCGIVLTKLDLKGVDLRDAQLRDADLTGTDLTRANLERADLSGAMLVGQRSKKRTLSKSSWCMPI